MNLVLFVGSLGAGGAQRQFAQLADALARRGHKVTLAASKPGGPYWDWLCHRDGGVNLVTLFPGPGRGGALLAPLRMAVSVWRLRRILRREQAHVLYSALYLSNVLAWLAARQSGGTEVVWGIRASRQDLGWKRRVPYELCRLMSSSVPLIIANSQAGANDFRRAGFQPQAMVVIANGIDTSSFVRDVAAGRALRQDWGIEDGLKVIGLAGRIAPVKGHEVFLRSASILTAQRADVRFVCIGDGPEAYVRRLRRLAEELGLAGRVFWVGECRDMRAAYSALDLACCPSHSEGFPNVVAEAMACEVPCVASDVGDMKQIVGSTGVLVPPDDAQALACGISRVLDDPTVAAIAAAGRRRIAEHFSIDSLVRRTEQALDSVANRPVATLRQATDAEPR